MATSTKASRFKATNDVITVNNSVDGFVINGGSGNDKISARGLNNTVIGGSGNDLFTIGSNTSNSTILDFSSSKDLLLIERGSWSNSSTMDRAHFLVRGVDPTATSTKGQFLYDTDDGRLLYDSDGTGATTAAVVFTFSNKVALTTSHFLFDF
jgi:Ca2+-binding RTX toxin-like protein